jgi:phosphate transport system protein
LVDLKKPCPILKIIKEEKMHIRVLFNEKVNSLNQNILKMGALVNEAMQKSVHCFINKDLTMAHAVIQDDKQIDKMQVLIESEIIALLALESPVARDLRDMITDLKTASKLERMGDYAAHIAKAALKLKESIQLEKLKLFVDIVIKMSGICTQMLQNALGNFLEKNIANLKAIALQDEEINAHHKEFIKHLYDKNNNLTLEEFGVLLFLARYLERLGDHVVSICESLIFAKEGDHIEL